jgi:hypothetical protein
MTTLLVSLGIAFVIGTISGLYLARAERAGRQ